MRLYEIKDQLGPKTPSIEDLIKKYQGKHSADYIKNQLEKGIAVELEHTDRSGRQDDQSAKELASEIARDHINEFPDYYDRLTQAEK
jgi:predicted solute-binding protein